MRRLALAALAGLALAGVAAAAALKTKTAQRGPVRAIVSWHEDADMFVTNGRLRISRNGRTLVNRKLPPYNEPRALQIRDFDGDGEQEVIADLYTGGAHCCLVSRIYRYTRATYVPLEHDWGNAPYRLRGRVFVSADDRFAYVFTSYASSAFPVQVWRYRAGRMGDVTGRFPNLIRADAARQWTSYRYERTQKLYDVRGILAAWLADQYLLHSEKRGWAKVSAIARRGELTGANDPRPWAAGNAYLRALRKYLRKLRYAA